MTDNMYNVVDYGPSTGGTVRRPPDRTERKRQVHAFFFFVAFIAAVGGAFYAYDQTESIALPIFVFGMVQFYVGRGLGDVATDPQKVQRFIYFSLLPVLASGVLWLTYQWWGLMWLSAILGFLIGGLLWNFMSMAFFSSIHEAETHDTEERQKTGGL